MWTEWLYREMKVPVTKNGALEEKEMSLAGPLPYNLIT